jgi:hypothetical protein
MHRTNNYQCNKDAVGANTFVQPCNLTLVASSEPFSFFPCNHLPSNSTPRTQKTLYHREINRASFARLVSIF